MNVPNHEKKVFKDMTPEERSAIVEAWIGGNAEVYYSPDDMWAAKADAYIFTGSIYRTRPRQLVIPWEHIKPEYKWAAMDESGSVWVYEDQPELDGDVWLRGGGLETIGALNIDPTDIDWRESLVQRPE